MEIICSTEKLKKTLEHTERIVARHITLPILNNVLIKTDKNGLKISSTNLELGVNSWFPCKVVKSGEITVPAKVFYNIISVLNSDKVVLEIKKNNILHINSVNYQATLKGEDSKDFPIIPKLNKSIVFEVDPVVFCKSLNQIIGFVSNSETRPEITGVFLYKSTGDNNLFVVSTDSFRLGERIIILSDDYKNLSFAVIVPAKTISELIRIFSDYKNNIVVNIENNQIGFESDKTELISRLIEGNYPDYKKLIPTDFNTVASVNKDNFVKTIKLVSLFSGRINDIKLSFVKGNTPKLVLYAGDSDLGESDASLDIELTGEGLDIKFNWRYLLDGVAGATDSIICFNFINEGKPCLVKFPKDKNFIYLVMPIRT
ncbi:MAG: DNA polymerase III subunit beta [Parcubacteria group bacterium]|nr:DNA polymerase III subunit beta [Parcubacteria group bacterium]